MTWRLLFGWLIDWLIDCCVVLAHVVTRASHLSIHITFLSFLKLFLLHLIIFVPDDYMYGKTGVYDADLYQDASSGSRQKRSIGPPSPFSTRRPVSWGRDGNDSDRNKSPQQKRSSASRNKVRIIPHPTPPPPPPDIWWLGWFFPPIYWPKFSRSVDFPPFFLVFQFHFCFGFPFIFPGILEEFRKRSPKSWKFGGVCFQTCHVPT